MSEKVFIGLMGNFFEIEYDTPKDYIEKYWQAYQNHPNRSNSLNGKIFEYILATLCVRENILPFYLEAKVEFVPNVNYDLIFYTKERGPICWSIKTSLRERYKQADLEATALKNVHRRALSYLITLEEKEIQRLKEKINNGEVIGLDNVILANSPEFDQIIMDLKKYDLYEAPQIRAVYSNHLITETKVRSVQSNLKKRP